MIGQTISHYRIVKKLGEGGMGVVYKAEDLKLGRAVALKFLPSHLLESEEHKARFLHEARAAASLDHPNISTVYEIDEVEGRALLAMACLEGQTLKQKIAERPLPLSEALDIALQIGQGLQAAHEEGIVHRDIKPANIMITSQGLVKIMDFGLAQLSDRTKLTATGMKLGTPAYMSPEQTAGQPADRRSDIWSLGVVLYEMVSGGAPFAGEAEAAVAYAIVQTEPEPLTALRSGLPTALDRIVEKALSKKPGDRYQHVEDLLVDLHGLRRSLDGARPPLRAVTGTRGAPQSPARRYVYGGVAGLAVLMAALVTWLIMPKGNSSPHTTSVEAPFRRFGIDPPDSLALQMPWQQTLVLSPDGRRIAGLMGGQLWIFNFDQGEWSPVEGSNGARISVFWSPDSGSVAFVVGNELRVVSVEAGAVRTICRLPGFLGGSWSPDGEIILFSGAPPNLYEVAAAGGEPRVALTFAQIEEQIRSEPERQLPPNWLTYPSFLPLGNGRRVILFAVGSGAAGNSIALHDFDSGETKILAEGSPPPLYSPTGHLLYLQPERSGAAYDIVAQPFSLDRLQTSGSPFTVVQGGLSPTVARDGTLAYLDAPAFQLTFVDRTGAKLRDVGPVAMGYYYPALSPDGNTVAVEVHHGDNLDIWTLDLGRDVRLRVSDNPATDLLPVWSPSGDELAFSSNRSGITKIFVRPADGSAVEREIPLETQQPDRIGDWSGDGQTIVYSTLHPDTGQDLWALVRSDGHTWERQPFLATSQNELSPKLSPDGRYLAYLSDETGRFEVYLRPFPDGGRKWLVSSGGGAAQIRWRRDGQELFYSEAGQMMAISVQLIPTLKLSAPQRLFTHQLYEALDPNYDVTSDGRQFLMALEATAKRKVRIIQNWQAGF